MKTKKSLHGVVAIVVGVVILFSVAFLLLQLAGKLFVQEITQAILVPEIHAPNDLSPVVSHLAPDFSLEDLAGKTVTAGQLVGNPTLLFFWSTWSADSLGQLKIVDDMIADGVLPNVTVYAINSQEDTSIVRNLIVRGGYKVPILLDTTGAVTELYDARTLPTLFVIDAKGVVQKKIIGSQSSAELVDNFDKVN